MKFEIGGTPARSKIIIALLVAAAGVVVQMAAGAAYPTIPPVFFILLLPAALIGFVKRRWVFVVPLVAALFLTLGLFTSGAYKRLFYAPHPVDAAGLWIQSVAVLLAIIFSIAAIAQKQPLAA